ncbi:hypothetical protein FXB39_01965 [Nocardioides sp. BGMRC 2183]|nr:hypothetical protein FXB39_01965 [Nocardioides sp. BGMRC 2183]
MSSRHSRARAALACSLLILATTSCGTDDSGGGPAQSQFERDLEAMPGVTDAHVEREAFDTDYWGEQIAVDMELDATPAQVSDVLDAFIDRRHDQNGAPQDAHVTLGAGTTDTDGDEFSPDAPPLAVPAGRKVGNPRVAGTLVAGAAAFPGDNVTVTGSNWSVNARADGDDPRTEIDRMIETVQADDLLSATKSFDLTAFAGPESDERTVQFSVFDTLTPELVQRWQDLSPHLDAPEFRALWLSPEWIELRVRAGEDVKPRDLTTQRYGDTLWPMLHATLDTLVAMPKIAELTATNEWDVTAPEEGGGYLEDRFLKIRPNLRPAQDRLDRTWNAEAGRYLR